MDFLDILKAVLMLLAGLGTFLVGLKLMGDNLENLAGDNLKSLFTKISNKKVLGIATGCVTTIITQSSSATTVMVVGFVNTGMMTLLQATSIIMGANIGTTITAYIIALQDLPVSAFFAALACVGAFMSMSKKSKLKNIGTTLTGVGILFVGLYVMSSSMKNITTIQNASGELVVNKLILSLSNSHILLLLIGAALTALIQSSAATTSILIGLCASGAMTLEPALYVTLGMNIGTCITAILASIGASTNAKRASMVHLLFNLIGTIIFYIFISFLGKGLCTVLDKVSIASDSGTRVSLQIALFHTLFNVTTTLLMYPLMKQLTQLATLIVPERKSTKSEEEIDKFTYIDTRLLNTPTIAMIMLRKEIVKMGEDAKQNLDLAINMMLSQDLSKKEEFAKREAHLDFLNKNITKFLVKVSSSQITYENEKEIAAYYHNISDFERIGDYAENLIEYTEDLINAHIDFSEESKKELTEMKNSVFNLMDATIVAFESKSLKDEAEIRAYEDLIDTYFDELSKSHIIRLNRGLCKAEAGSAFISTIGHLERIGDHTMNVFSSMKTYIKSSSSTQQSPVQPTPVTPQDPNTKPETTEVCNN